MEVRKVLERKDGIKMAIIPKSSGIKKDDFVLVLKLTPNNLTLVNKLMEEKNG